MPYTKARKLYRGAVYTVDTEYGERITVKELQEILSECNPDDEIIIGAGTNDCDEDLLQIWRGYSHSKNPGVILFSTCIEE